MAKRVFAVQVLDPRFDLHLMRREVELAIQGFAYPV